MVVTYNAYAAALLSEHGLRIGHEPDTRVMADASRYQVAARAIERHTGAVELLSEHPKTAIDYLLGLDAELNEHLVSGRAGAGVPRGTPGRRSRRRWRRRGPKADIAKAHREDGRARGGARPGRGLPRAQGAVRPDGLLRPDRPGAPSSPGRSRRSAGWSATKYRVVLLDEYQDTSVAQAQLLGALFSGPDAATRAGPRGHGGRRSQPGDLRLAGRVGVQHPQLRRDLPVRGRRRRCRRTP